MSHTNQLPEPPLPPLGSMVVCACKGVIRFEETTRHTLYRGRRIFFCLPSCLTTFKQDPATSCLAGDTLLEEGE